MHGHRHAVAIALLLAAPRLFAACEETLRPALVRELTAPALKYAGSVAWLDDEAVAIGAAGGVFEYTLADGALRNLVPSRPIPHGLGNDSGCDPNWRWRSPGGHPHRNGRGHTAAGIRILK